MPTYKQNTIKTGAFLFRDSKKSQHKYIVSKGLSGLQNCPQKISSMEKIAKLIRGGEVY